MPLKITKEMSSHLIKYVRTVNFSFNAFDSRTRSAREVMRQFEAQRLVRANPKLKVKADVHSRPSAPEVKVSFVDGTDLTFDSQEYIAADMLMDIWRAAMKLDDEFELEGKNVEDVA
mmetsp:Transcript_8956/g.20825  ORF Transcript_8956/g.20825 Transcript_8956/m.20825 type:complete len:117 (-) Transcript_8956:85-435(-)